MNAVPAAFRTDRSMTIDLSVPIWTIDPLAAAFHLSVDDARESTDRADFPAAKDGFARNLWMVRGMRRGFAAGPA